MSHVVDIKTELTDLEAVKAACKELGLTFKENQKTYHWWGSSVGDYPLPAGVTREQLGLCDHALGVPGTSWEIGLVRQPGSKGYRMLFDFFGHQGKPILAAIGGEEDPKTRQLVNGGGRFLQCYAIHKTTLEARKRGYIVTRLAGKNGAVNLQITGM